MMPKCNYRGCNEVADQRLGEISTGEKDGFGKDWPTTVYVCKKCYKTICEDLGLKTESED